MTICDKCHNNMLLSMQKFYNKALTEIELSLPKAIPKVISKNILYYAYDNNVKVEWVKKISVFCNCRGCQYDRLSIHNETLEDCHIYTCKRRLLITTFLCSKCFVEGIERCHGRLPYLNFHINNCFLNDAHIEVNPYKYVLPKYYRLFYYRRSLPVKKENKLFITPE